MRKFSLALAATTALTLAGAASAQSWMPIQAREAMLDSRIDAGLRNGDLNRSEAMRLRAEFNAIVDLEDRYRVDGLSWSERRDLDHRFDALSARLQYARNDVDRGWFGGRNWADAHGRWVSIEDRKIQLDRRIDHGLRSGQLTRAEAARLRAQFDDIARVEYRYRADGLSRWEIADLNRRFDQLAMQIRDERTDPERRYGYNEPPRY